MNKIFSLKYCLFNYGCSVILTIVLILFSVIPFVGYFSMFFIIGGLVYSYYLTNLFKISLTILSFLLNFIAWTAEQVTIESNYHHTQLYQSGDYNYLVVLLGTILWVTNKMLIDFLFILFKATPNDKMRIELLSQKYFISKDKTIDRIET